MCSTSLYEDEAGDWNVKMKDTEVRGHIGESAGGHNSEVKAFQLTMCAHMVYGPTGGPGAGLIYFIAPPIFKVQTSSDKV